MLKGGRSLWSAEIKAFGKEERTLISTAGERRTSGVFSVLGQLFLQRPVSAQIALVVKSLKGCPRVVPVPIALEKQVFNGVSQQG